MAASRKLAARKELVATAFGRRSGRPDLMCAAQHPEFDRCATNYIAAIENAGPRLVIDHMGRPEAGSGGDSEGFMAVLRAVERGKTWVKISGGFRIQPDGYAATIVSKLLRNVGPQRLMWGSDWPFSVFEDRMSYKKTIADYKRYVPDVSIRRSIDPNGSCFLFCLNKARTPEHGYNRKTADRFTEDCSYTTSMTGVWVRRALHAPTPQRVKIMTMNRKGAVAGASFIAVLTLGYSGSFVVNHP
jgi:hypothetical protein